MLSNILHHIRTREIFCHPQLRTALPHPPENIAVVMTTVNKTLFRETASFSKSESHENVEFAKQLGLKIKLKTETNKKHICKLLGPYHS